jgi:hypothetical protein
MPELADGRSGEMFINELQASGHEGSTALGGKGDRRAY